LISDISVQISELRMCLFLLVLHPLVINSVINLSVGFPTLT